MVTQVAAHSYQTMTANDKGSFVNRTKCAGAHITNDVKYNVLGAGVLAGGAVAGYGVYKKPDLVVKAFEKAGQWVSKFGSKLTGVKNGNIAKAGTLVEKYATKVLEKLPKYGKAGALAGVALLTLGALTGVISKHSYQAGKIDQKYIDQAKLENMTGTIIV